MNRKSRISIGCGILFVVWSTYAAVFWYRVVKPWARSEPELVLIQHIVYGETDEALALIRAQRTFSTHDRAGPYEGFHPLHLAAEYQDMACVETLLEYGADVNVRNDEGSTPLMSAVFRADGTNHGGAEMCISKLIEHGADIDAANKHGWTALHNAVYIDDVRMIKFLVEQGASINQSGTAIGTPLHLGAFGGRVLAVETLLDLGADATIKNQSGQTPLEAARAAEYRDNSEVIDVLEKHDAALLDAFK